MEPQYADLHIHTTFSDGSFSPQEAVRQAHQAGFTAISITDHDIVDGIPSALAEGTAIGLEVIPGVELSTEVRGAVTTEMHILGYFINWENAQFKDSLGLFRKARTQRAHQIIDKLLHLGIRLDKERLFSIAGDGSIGRLHFAKLMVEQGICSDINDAFHKYLGIGKAAYVPKLSLKPEEAIRMIVRTGGIAVLAHPYYGHYSNRNLLKGLVSAGLRGIEVWHSKHPPATVKMFSALASDLGLLSTGGSDWHGTFINEPSTLGKIKIPYSSVLELKKYKDKIDRENKDILI
jgi:predicted metal-dependent phosphoesterase TrpH